MFKWYRRSSKCYVLLSDVYTHHENDDLTVRDSQLRRSRWFTRGWTLQELLAPPQSLNSFLGKGTYLVPKNR